MLKVTFAEAVSTDYPTLREHLAFMPCVDGSGLARTFFTCSAGRCGHVSGLFARFA
jgi:hypothetical protein